MAFASSVMSGKLSFWFWVIATIPFYGATWERYVWYPFLQMLLVDFLGLLRAYADLRKHSLQYPHFKFLEPLSDTSLEPFSDKLSFLRWVLAHVQFLHGHAYPSRNQRSYWRADAHLSGAHFHCNCWYCLFWQWPLSTHQLLTCVYMEFNIFSWCRRLVAAQKLLI